MKKVVFYFTLLMSFLFFGCQSDNDPEGVIYEFEATVLGKGIDCGGTFLIDLSRKHGDSDIKNGTYFADNLPDELKVKGIKLKLNCRKPTIDEAYPCTTLGPGYYHVVVLESVEK